MYNTALHTSTIFIAPPHSPPTLHTSPPTHSSLGTCHNIPISKSSKDHNKLAQTTNFIPNYQNTRKNTIIIHKSRVVQLLHSCGPLFKIIQVCGPQSAKNSYFRSKIKCSLKKKKKGLHLESVCKIPIFVPKSGCSLKKKKKKVFTWNRSPKFLFWRKIIAFSKKNYSCCF